MVASYSSAALRLQKTGLWMLWHVAVLELMCVVCGIKEASAMQPLQFRPNLYFGVRERSDPGFMLGMGWFKGSKVDEFRHDAREHDHLSRWGFLKADEDYGKQSFLDGWLHLTTEHLFQNGSEMVVRINGSVQDGKLPSAPSVVSLFFTVHSPLGVSLSTPVDSKGLRGDSVRASLNTLGHKLNVYWGDSVNPHDDDVCTELTERVRPGKSAPELSKTHFSGWVDPDLSLAFLVKDNIKSILKQSEGAAKEVARKLYKIYEPSEEAAIHKRIAPVLNNKIYLSIEDNTAKAAMPTTMVFQRVLKAPFSVIVTLVADSVSTAGKNNNEQEPYEEERIEEQVGRQLLMRENAFDNRFDISFPALAQLASKTSDTAIDVAKAALGNTVGSVGWFFGSNLLDDQTWSQPPGSLLTGVPSRSFFPRGFFWDEGFHQLLVGRFNSGLAKQVIASWLTRFDKRGWVAREQVLGLEAIERVPREFLTQNRTFANPPTILLAVESLFDRRGGDNDLAFYGKVFDTFMLHRRWLSKSQQSRHAEGLMAWKGRSLDAVHTLTSGIDDYPRGLPGDFYREAHVDLLSWACWEDKMLAKLGEKLGKGADDVKMLQESAERRWTLLVKHHWNPSLGFFNDLGFLSDQSPGAPNFVPHIGYVGLMPFVLKLIPPVQSSMDMLWDILKALQDPKLLRAPGIGIRSLARSDRLFGQGENYWRGAVWININYLCVQALEYYAAQTQSVDASYSNLASGLAREFRKDLVENIVRRYREEGYLFESYDSVTGKGRGTRPFTGWTALLVLMMDEEATVG